MIVSELFSGTPNWNIRHYTFSGWTQWNSEQRSLQPDCPSDIFSAVTAINLLSQHSLGAKGENKEKFRAECCHVKRYLKKRSMLRTKQERYIHHESFACLLGLVILLNVHGISVQKYWNIFDEFHSRKVWEIYIWDKQNFFVSVGYGLVQCPVWVTTLAMYSDTTL